MATEAAAASPALAVMARRASREATAAKRKVAASDADADDDDDWEWTSEGSGDEDGEAGEDGGEADGGRRKSLLEKGWARRSIVVHGLGPSGADEMEAVPGREAYGSGDDGAAQWAEDMLEYAEENFNNQGIEVRSLDQRERKVGLFGNFLERVGHGKFLEWRADVEEGGLYKLEVVTKVVENELGGLCEVPLLPTWGMVLEYSVKAAIGHPTAPKGGTPEYRNGPWYKKVYGKAQGEKGVKG